MTATDDIISAAQRGDHVRVTALLDQDAGLVGATNMFGATPIHAAHFSGHQGVVELLHARGRVRDAFLAAELGRLDELRHHLALHRSFAREFNAAGSTALHAACYWGSVDAARLLLEHGADPNVDTRDAFLKIRPLGSAVATPNVPNPSDDEGVILRLVDLLLDHDAAVNAQRRDGMTALHTAAYRGHLGVIRRLLERGADPTIRAYADAGAHANESPLDTARTQNQHDAVRLLRTLG